MKYKVLTLTQPWATLVAIGAKKIETRSWPSKYRGPLLIHAAQGLGPVGGVHGLLLDVALSTYKRDALVGAGYREVKDLPRGAIVAVAELVEVYQIPDGVNGFYVEDSSILFDLTDQERAFGDYTPGRYAWLLDNVRRLPEPIPARGALGLWDWEGDVEEVSAKP